MMNFFSGRVGRVLLLVSLLFAALAAPALAQDAGVIDGSVTNGGTGQPVAGMTVSLDRFDGVTAAQSLTAQTDSQGKYRFDKLPVGDKLIYVVRVNYANVEYPSGMITLKTGQTSQTVPLQVFDTTEDGSGIAIERAHVIVRPTDAGVTVSEMIAISNSGKGAYVGKAAGADPATTLRFYLPTGYTDLGFDAGTLGERFLPLADGFADTQPVRPGVSVDQIVFSYALPAQRGSWSVDYRLAYPTKALNVLVAAGWVVSGPGVTYVGKMGSSESAYLNYQVKDVSPDKAISLAFALGAAPAGGVDMTTAGNNTTETAEATPSGPSNQPTLLWIAIAGMILALAAAATYPIWGGAAGGGREA